MIHSVLDSVGIGVGGDYSLSLFEGSWNAGDTIVARFKAKNGFEFQFAPHSQIPSTVFSVQMLFEVDPETWTA
jgi:hypothetical protein